MNHVCFHQAPYNQTIFCVYASGLDLSFSAIPPFSGTFGYFLSCSPPAPTNRRECICLLCLYSRVLFYSREALKIGLRGGTGNHQNLPPEFSHRSLMMPCLGMRVTSTWPTKASACCCPDAGFVCPCTQFWIYNVYI